MFRRTLSMVLCLTMVLASLPLQAMAETMPECEHDYRSETMQKATCTEAGTVIWRCDCGDSFTEDVPELGHSFEEGICTLCGEADPSVPEEITERTDEPTDDLVTAETETMLETVTLNPLEDVEIGEDGTAAFVLEYTCSAEELLSFQWQRLDPVCFAEEYPEATPENREAAWEDISDATESTFELQKITADCQEEYTRYSYRCVVSANGQNWVSEEAALFWTEPENTEPEETEPEETDSVQTEAMETEPKETESKQTELVREEFAVMSTNAVGTPAADFSYTSDGYSITITGYKGTSADVQIPAQIDALPVTKIASGAFAKNTTIRSVEVPEGVTEIADSSNSSSGAFCNCTALESVMLPESLTKLGKYAFYNCSVLSEINIPSELETIKGYTFYGCKALTEIELNDGLKTIESNAFSNSGITRLELPDSVTSVSLSGASSQLTYIRWTAGIPVLGNSQFQDMKKLETVILPEGVTTIPDGGHETPVGSSYTYYWGVFRDCTALKAVVFPSTLTHIGSYAFEGCTSLETIEFGGSGCSIGDNVFEGCTALQYAKIKSGTEQTGKKLFYKCTSLEEVELPDSLLSIDSNAFYGCSVLKKINIPKSLKVIGDSAFSGCKQLTEINLTDGLETIGGSAFSSTGITRLELPDSVTSVSLSGLSSQLTYIRWTAGIPVLGTSQFKDMKKLETVILPEGVTTIPDGGHETPVGSSYTNYWGPFRGCTSLKNVAIPSTVTYIGNYAFEGCTSLESFEFGAGVKEIGSYVFDGCAALSEIKLNDGLETIGSHAFDSCILQEKLIIPDTVTTIGSYAFENCKSLTEVQLPALLETIESHAFQNCTKLTEVNLPAGIKVIGSSAFSGCAGITEIELPDGLTTIGSSAFSGTAITVLELPDSVTSVSLTGLKNQLTHVRWTAGIPILSGSVFQDCVTLKSVVLPEGVTELADASYSYQEFIGGGMFYFYAPFMDCYSLESIVLPNSLTKIGDKVFEGCSKLSFVQFGKNLSSVHKQAFSGCPDFTLSVWPGTWGEQWAIDNGKEYTYAGANGILDVTLDPEAFSGMQMILISGGARRMQRIGQQTTYRFSGLEEGTTGTLRIQNAYGDTILEQEIHISPTSSIALENSRIGSAQLTILDENGNDVSSQVTVEWFRATGEPYASGLSLQGLPVGRELTAKIRLNEKYGKIYYFPGDVKLSVAVGANPATVTLDRIPVVSVSGVVTDGNGPLAGASVVLAQTINGKYISRTTVVTDRNGVYEAEIPASEAVVTVGAFGYMDQQLSIAAPAENVQLETVALEKVTGTEITLEVTCISSAEAGEEHTQTVLPNLNNLEFSAYNKTQNATVEYLLAQGTTLILADHSAPGDILEITAKHLGDEYCGETVTVTVDGNNSAHCAISMVQRGSVLVNYTSTRNEAVQSLIYDTSGNRVWMGGMDAEKQETVSGLLADGDYTVVLMGTARILNYPNSLSGFEQMGLRDGTDYVQKAVTVETGTVTRCAIGTVPLLDESRFYYTDPDATSYIASKTSITAGNFFTLRAEAPIAQMYRAQISNLKWIFVLSDGLELRGGTLSVNGSTAVEYSYDAGVITLPVEDPAQPVRFCANATGQGEAVSQAYLEFTYQDRIIRQSIGNVTVKIGELDFEITEKTFTPSITVSGTAAGNAEIRIYDGGVLVGQTQSNTAGYWQLSFELYKPGTLSEHHIFAEMELATGTRVRSKTHTVTYQYSPAPVEVKLVSMYMGNSSTPAVVFNFKDPQTRNMSYSVEGGTTFTFVSEFDCEDLSRLSDVKLEVSLSNNTTRVLDMLYSEAMNGFVTSCYFNFDALPVNVAVSYLCDEELIFSGDHLADVKADVESLTDLYEELGEDDLFSFGAELAPMTLPEEDEDVPYSEDLIQAVAERNEALENYLNIEQSLKETQEELAKSLVASNNAVSMTNDLFETELIQEQVSAFSIEDKVAEGYSVFRVGEGNAYFVLTRLIINDETGAIEQTVIDTSPDGRGFAYFAENADHMVMTTASNGTVTPPEQNYSLPDGYYCPVQQVPQNLNVCELPPQTGSSMTAKVKPSRKFQTNPEMFDAIATGMSEMQSQISLGKDALEAFHAKDLHALMKQDTYKNRLWNNIEGYNQAYEDALKTDPDFAKALEKKLNNKLQKYDDLSQKIRDGYEANKKAWARVDKFGKVLKVTGPLTDAYSLGKDLNTLMELNRIIDQFDDAEAKHARAQLLARIATSITCIAAVFCLTGLGAVAFGLLFVPISWLLFSKLDDDVSRIKRKYAGGNAGGSGQPARPKIDPSGYIYEAVPSNRLPGVTVTCYERITKEDVYGDEYTEVQLWDAEEFDQTNPLTTDPEGRYSWDVPEGWWQVKAELEGYETTYSEWLPVPPPQLEVNLGMVSYAAPEMIDVFAQPNSVDVTFSKYLRADTVTGETITISVNGQALTGTIQLLNSEESPADKDVILVSKIRFVPEKPLEDGTHVTVSITGSILSYADVTAELNATAEATVVTIPETLLAPESVTLVYQGHGTIAIQAQPAVYAANETVQVQAVSDLFLNTQEQAVVLDENGCGLIHIEGLLPGETEIQFIMSDGRLSAKTRVKILMPNEAETVGVLNLSQSYLALRQGKSAELTAEVTPKTLSDQLVWTVEDGSEKIISVDASGKVLALNPGTGYVLVSATDGKRTVTERCRVDVAEKIALDGIWLGTTKVTSELYSTDYAEFEVLLELPQNSSTTMATYASRRSPEKRGVAIENAKFQNENAAEYFDLIPVDDRRLAVVPKQTAVDNPKAVKSSYKSNIIVTVGGTEYKSEALTLTVKKSTPKLKVSIPAFNSFYSFQTQEMVITGGTVTNIAVDESKNTAKTAAIPEWLNQKGLTLSLNEKAPSKSVSGKVYLLIETEEWRIPAAVTLTVKNTYKAPGLKLSASSVTVAKTASNGVTLKLQPKSKKDTLAALNVNGISGPADCVLSDLNWKNGEFILKANAPGKVALNVSFSDTDKILSLPLTVKMADVKLKLSKSSITLNKKTTDSTQITVAATPADFNLNLQDYRLTDAKGVDKKQSGELMVRLAGNRITINTTQSAVGTYKLYVCEGGSKEAALTIKIIEKDPTVTYKAKGNLDLSFPKNGVIITPTLKNYSGKFTFTETETENFSLIQNGKTIVARCKDNATPGTYLQTLSLTLEDGTTVENTVKITVKRTAVKLKLASTKLSLNHKVRDHGEIGVSCATKGYDFAKPVWNLMDKSGKNTADGELDIAWNNDKLVIASNDQTDYGATYKLLVKANSYSSAVTLSITIPAEAKSNVTATVKAKGSIDVIRDGTSITLTPSYKNVTAQTEKRGELVFYRTANKITTEANDLFAYKMNDDGTFTVTKAEDAPLDHSAKYTVKLVSTINGRENIESKPIALSIKQGSTKLTLTTLNNTLFAQDNYSRSEFTIAAKDGSLNVIKKIEIKDAKYKDLFEIFDYGNGSYAIGYKDNVVHKSLIPKKSSVTVTLNLNIFLEGNQTTKANTTAKLKLTIVK